MKLRSRYVTAAAALGDHITRLDLLAAIDEDLAVIAVDGDPSAFMADEDEVAERLEAVAGIDHDAGEARSDLRSFGHQDIYPFGSGRTSLAVLIIDDRALHGPRETG